MFNLSFKERCKQIRDVQELFDSISESEQIRLWDFFHNKYVAETPEHDWSDHEPNGERKAPDAVAKRAGSL